MNVLVIHNQYKQRGGEDVVVENEISLLKEMGFSVFEYIRSNDEIDKLGIIGKIFFPLSTIFSIKTYREIKKCIRDNSIDILHVHNTLLMVSPSVYYAGFNSKIPVFQTVHNFRLLCPNALFLRDKKVCEDCLKKGLMTSVRHKCYRNSTLQTLMVVIMTYIHRFAGTYNRLDYICMSEYSKNKLLLLNENKGVHINPEQIFVKSYFIYENNKTPGEETRKHFLYVGRLSAEKGIIDLLDAWEEYASISSEDKLIICGDGPEVDKVKTACNKIQSIEYAGKISHDKVLDYMKSAKGVIVPSICYETGPLSIIEAFSVGTPVIGSDMGNIGERITEGITGTKFTPNNPKSLVEAIIRFNKMDLNELSANAYKCYKDNYSVERNMELFREIYSKGHFYDCT